MKKAKLSKVFLDALRKVPVVQVACDRAGVSRNTIYRWKREDKEFARELEEAKLDGIEYVNDMSESQLLQLIKDRRLGAIRYWMSHNHNRFKKHVPNERVVQSPEEKRLEQEKMTKEINEMHDMWFSDCACGNEESDSEERDEKRKKNDCEDRPIDNDS